MASAAPPTAASAMDAARTAAVDGVAGAAESLLADAERRTGFAAWQVWSAASHELAMWGEDGKPSAWAWPAIGIAGLALRLGLSGASSDPAMCAKAVVADVVREPATVWLERLAQEEQNLHCKLFTSGVLHVVEPDEGIEGLDGMCRRALSRAGLRFGSGGGAGAGAGVTTDASAFATGAGTVASGSTLHRANPLSPPPAASAFSLLHFLVMSNIHTREAGLAIERMPAGSLMDITDMASTRPAAAPLPGGELDYISYGSLLMARYLVTQHHLPLAVALNAAQTMWAGARKWLVEFWNGSASTAAGGDGGEAIGIFTPFRIGPSSVFVTPRSMREAGNSHHVDEDSIALISDAITWTPMRLLYDTSVGMAGEVGLWKYLHHPLGADEVRVMAIGMRLAARPAAPTPDDPTGFAFTYHGDRIVKTVSDSVAVTPAHFLRKADAVTDADGGKYVVVEYHHGAHRFIARHVDAAHVTATAARIAGGCEVAFPVTLFSAALSGDADLVHYVADIMQKIRGLQSFGSALAGEPIIALTRLTRRVLNQHAATTADGVHLVCSASGTVAPVDGTAAASSAAAATTARWVPPRRGDVDVTRLLSSQGFDNPAAVVLRKIQARKGVLAVSEAFALASALRCVRDDSEREGADAAAQLLDYAARAAALG